jgi:hypothetical protein
MARTFYGTPTVNRTAAWGMRPKRMPKKHLIATPSALLALLVSIFLAGCFSPSRRDSSHQEWVERERRECESVRGVCRAAMVQELSLESLKLKASELRVDCGLEFIDYDEESARSDCEKNVMAAMGALVSRWPDHLSPTKPEQLSFDLEDQGCISLTNGYCACTFSGSARVPLVWKTLVRATVPE